MAKQRWGGFKCRVVQFDIRWGLIKFRGDFWELVDVCVCVEGENTRIAPRQWNNNQTWRQNQCYMMQTGLKTLFFLWANIGKEVSVRGRIHHWAQSQILIHLLAVSILGSKPPMWPSFLRLGLRISTEGAKLGVCFGPPIWCLRGNTLFHLHCYVYPSRQCAGSCVRWVEVSMTCTLVKTRKQLITAGSPSLHPQTVRWATGQPLRSKRC